MQQNFPDLWRKYATFFPTFTKWLNKEFDEEMGLTWLDLIDSKNHILNQLKSSDTAASY